MKQKVFLLNTFSFFLIKMLIAKLKHGIDQCRENFEIQTFRYDSGMTLCFIILKKVGIIKLLA